MIEKFRGWCFLEHISAWVYGDPVHEPKGPVRGIHPYDVPWESDPYPVIPESVGMSTGLADMLGNEVYEGDIVAIPLETVEVLLQIKWNNGAFWRYSSDGEQPVDLFDELAAAGCAVVGNAYRDPELTKLRKRRCRLQVQDRKEN